MNPRRFWECWLEIDEAGVIHMGVGGGPELVALREMSLAGVREAYWTIMAMRKDAAEAEAQRDALR